MCNSLTLLDAANTANAANNTSSANAANADGLALGKSNVPKRCKKDAATVRADGTDVDCCSFPPELVMIAHTHTCAAKKQKKNKMKHLKVWERSLPSLI